MDCCEWYRQSHDQFTGLVTAVDNGTITAVAAANDGSGIYGNIGLTLSNQIVTLTSLSLPDQRGLNYYC